MRQDREEEGTEEAGKGNSEKGNELAGESVSGVEDSIDAGQDIDLTTLPEQPSDDQQGGGQDTDLTALPEQPAKAEHPPLKEKTLRVTGMMCEHCEAAVKGALEKVPGVKEASASHEAGTAKVLLDGEISDEALKNAVEAIGYIVDGVE